MANHTARLYVAAVTLGIFFVLWAAIAAHPWTAVASPRPEVDPRLAALDRRERQLQREAVLVKRLVDRRWAAYRTRLRARQAAIAAATRRHEQQLAAARAAEARIATLRATQATASPAAQPAQPRTVITYDVTRVRPAPVVVPAATPAPAPRAVQAPPPVQVVTLPPATPPATTSTSSRP